MEVHIDESQAIMRRIRQLEIEREKLERELREIANRNQRDRASCNEGRRPKLTIRDLQ